MAPTPLALGLAFSAGVATFFSPCSIALLPAYVGAFLGLDTDPTPDQEHLHADPLKAAGAGARFGGAAALGILLVFVLVGTTVLVLRRALNVPPTLLGETVRWIAVGVGGLLVLLGVLMLLDRAPSLHVPLQAPQRKTTFGMLAFGAVFALGSMGCTLPIFLAMVAQAMAQSLLGGFVTFLVYGAGVAALMLAASVALGIAQEEARTLLRNATRYVKPTSAIVLVAAGVYVVAYYLLLLPA